MEPGLVMEKNEMKIEINRLITPFRVISGKKSIDWSLYLVINGLYKENIKSR